VTPKTGGFLIGEKVQARASASRKEGKEKITDYRKGL